MTRSFDRSFLSRVRTLAGCAPALARRSAPRHPTGPILIADDQRDQTDSMAVLFELTGHAVLRAYSGAMALELAEAFRPRWLLLDLVMPALTGCEVAERVRLSPWRQGARLLAITGFGRAEDRERAFAAGFDHYFLKPVDFGELTAVMQEPRLPAALSEN